MSKRQFPEPSATDYVLESTSNIKEDRTATKVVSPTTVTTGALRNIYASTNAPVASDGADGDIWLKYV
jgi:hypothetical protein